MEEEPCRATSFSRGGAALRQVTRLEGLQDLPVPRPGCPGWAPAWGSHPPDWLGGLAVTGEMGAGWLP